MKYLLTFLAAFLLLTGRGEAAPVPLRGVIEGFYGTPWTEDARLDMLAFCGRTGLNAYIYAPKDDPYHREKWREPYPAAELSDLARLVAAAKADGVRFIFAVSPGLDLHLGSSVASGGATDPNAAVGGAPAAAVAGISDGSVAADRAAMLAKFEALYELGVRDFAIFFDDIQSRDGAGQAAFLRAIDTELRARHADVHPLITVPTEYSYDIMQDGQGTPTAYTREFAAGLKGTDILVLYTGDGVARGGLTAESLAKARALCGGRPLGLWWNYPVSDYDEAKLALGPIEKLPLGDVPAIFFNPMKHERLSKIALATGAALAKDPENYDPETAWHQAIEDQYGAQAAAMETFADHSTHMKNSWADIGRPDAPEFRHAAHGLFAAIDQGAPEAVTLSRIHDLDARISAIEEDASTLEQNLDDATLEEFRPQLQRLQIMAAAARSGLRLLEDASDEAARAQFRALRQKLAEDTSARISDDAIEVLLDGITERVGE
ncbi:MAG: protein O-GlcNAcase [Selenomonas sp.]|nr:protein O-GlcNAcase [Selenomonas sp.]